MTCPSFHLGGSQTATIVAMTDGHEVFPIGNISPENAKRFGVFPHGNMHYSEYSSQITGQFKHSEHEYAV